MYVKHNSIYHPKNIKQKDESKNKRIALIGLSVVICFEDPKF